MPVSLTLQPPVCEAAPTNGFYITEHLVYLGRVEVPGNQEAQ